MANQPTEPTATPEVATPEITMNPATTKELEYDGYKFKVDTDMLDDVEVFEQVERIENKHQLTAIVPLLEVLIGKTGYQQMKEYFVKKDGRFKITKLSKVYEVIINNFDPKD